MKTFQMSESSITIFFLTLSGGFQDAYTYVMRGGVFANAQTGNIVLFATNMLSKEWSKALGYLIPILAFSFGIFLAEMLRTLLSKQNKIHWRQIILLLEIAMLLSVGFISKKLDFLANAIVSASCALQVESFRKLKGKSFASTMCIGNLRSGTEHLYKYIHTKNKEDFIFALSLCNSDFCTRGRNWCNTFKSFWLKNDMHITSVALYKSFFDVYRHRKDKLAK